MHSQNASSILLKPLAAVAIILLPIALSLGSLGLVLGAPLVVVGLVLASPGIAALHALRRPWLRYHVALGTIVGAALALACAGIVATGNTDPHDIKTLTLRVGSIFAFLGGGFGAWSGLIWWTFFGRRRFASRAPPQCKVSAAIE
jgi:hypothetical protein